MTRGTGSSLTRGVNRSPDEEGITTPVRGAPHVSAVGVNRSPDEEGITTQRPCDLHAEPA